MDLFANELPKQPRSVADYVATGDKKGLISYLKSLSQKELFEQVVRAGFSMIGFHHGKNKVIEHVINQLN